jgi:hypothetical protein
MVAVTASALTAVGPAVAHGVRHALFSHNSDKVDGIHARTYTSKPAKRVNKLVAAGAAGYLPNNIIRKAVDANALDGRDSTEFALETVLSAPGTMNDPSNPVDWTKLKGVPGDFADGADDTGGTPSDLACSGCVGTSDLADDAVATAKIGDAQVSEAKLVFDPATQGELNNHASSGDHDGRYFTQSQLSSDGTINESGNPVHWTKLLGVPGDFADGADANTVYSAGSGIDITGTTVGLSSTGCSTDEVWKWDGFAWSCEPDFFLLGDGTTIVNDLLTGTLSVGTIDSASIVDEAALKAGSEQTGTVATTFPGSANASATVDFPASGYALITVRTTLGAQVGLSPPAGVIQSELREGSTVLDSWNWDPGDTDAYVDNAQSYTTVKSVTAGAHTYELFMKQQPDPSTGTNYQAARVTVVFSPSTL